MAPTGLLALQRKAGNRAVSDLVIQRFTKIPADQAQNKWGVDLDLRVSDDGHMAVKDSDTYPDGKQLQTFYADDGVISHSHKTLAKENSVYNVTGDDSEIISGTAPDGSGDRKLKKVIAENTETGASGNDMTTNEVCNVHAMQTMGVVGSDNQNPQPFGARLTPEKGKSKFIEGSHGQKNLTPVMEQVRFEMTGTKAYKPNKKAVKEIDELLQIPSKEKTSETSKRLRELQESESKPETKARNKARDKYEEMSEKDRYKKAGKLGVNQFAQAGVGQSYAIFKAGSSGSVGFHYVPIVATSGADSVSLENYAGNRGGEEVDKTQGAALRNPHWFYKMMGPVKKDKKGNIIEDQTLYGQTVELGKKGGDMGKAPIILGVEKGDGRL
jgi:hypothetical protein